MRIDTVAGSPRNLPILTICACSEKRQQCNLGYSSTTVRDSIAMEYQTLSTGKNVASKMTSSNGRVRRSGTSELVTVKVGQSCLELAGTKQSGETRGAGSVRCGAGRVDGRKVEGSQTTDSPVSTPAGSTTHTLSSKQPINVCMPSFAVCTDTLTVVPLPMPS